MTISTQEDYVAATNRFFSLFPLHLANVSKISIEKASHLKDGATLLHLFDLSDLNLKTKRIFLIDLYNRQRRTALFLRMAILENVDGYQPICVYCDNEIDYFKDDNGELRTSIFLNEIRKKLNFVEIDIKRLVVDFVKKQDITLEKFLNENPIYQLFLTLLNDENSSIIFPNNEIDIGSFKCGELCCPYPEIYIVSPDNTSAFDIKRDFSSNLFELATGDKREADDILSLFYYHILKCVTSEELTFPSQYLYNYSLNYSNYTKPYFVIGNSVYYCGLTNDSSFAEKLFADNEVLPENFDDLSKNKNIAFRDKYKFLAYYTKAKQILKDYKIEKLNNSLTDFNYDDIKNKVCEQIDLAAKILSERNKVIKAKIDSFNDIVVV
jgi:hypothetical protein